MITIRNGFQNVVIKSYAQQRFALRLLSSNNDPNRFDYQRFEEEIRQERQRRRNQERQQQNFNDESSGNNQSSEHSNDQSFNRSAGRSNAATSSVILTQQVAKDLQLLNVPKYVSKPDLKKQYHKLAKIYHPDVVSHSHGKHGQHQKGSAASSILTETQLSKLEERFKEFNLAYERLLKWVEERDKTLEDDLANNRRPGVQVNKEDGSVTYTIGKLQIEGKRSTLDKQQLLLDMIEDDLNMREPVNIKRHLIIIWLIFGVWVFYGDFKAYYKRMSQPREGIDYSQSFISLIKM